MGSEKFNDELNRLLGGMCDGTLSATEAARLDQLLQQDAAARQCYNNYLFLHAELYSQHTSLEAVENKAGCELGVADGGLDGAGISVQPAKAQGIQPRRRRLASLFVLAAALVGVAAVSSWITYAVALRPGAQQVASAEPAIDAARTVAKITATRNCLWQAGGGEVGFGSRLHPGQRLQLAAGLVEITFDDGAAVVLEGPATFDVRDRRQAQLHSGRLAAIVPPRATGFEVATQRVNVIDVGTEFGLMADPEGATEIHVFNGLVKAQLLDESGREMRLVELNTSEGARIQPATALVARIAARDEEFVRGMSVAPGPHDGLYAYDGFNYPDGPLAEQNGGFGWAGPWFAVEADAVPETSANGVEPGSLEYEDLVPLGNRALQTSHQNRIRRSLSTSVGGVFDAAGLVENQDGMRLIGRDGEVVYLSFLQRVNKTADVFYGLELHRSDGNANRVMCIGHGAEGTGYGVTSNFNVYGQRNFPALGTEDTKANFFVVRMTFGPGNRDRVEVFRNPKSLINEDLCIVNAELVGNFAFDRISLGNFHGTKIHEVDEIRVGTTFRAVTGRRSRGPDRLVPRVAMSPERHWLEAGSRGVELPGGVALLASIGIVEK